MAHEATIRTIGTFQLVIEAYALNEWCDGPAYAVVAVDQAFCDRLARLSQVCRENDLESATVSAAPDRWHDEDTLRIRGDSLRVCGDAFWFEAHPKHADYGVETRIIEIAALLKVIEAGVDVPSPDDCFAWSKGRLYYARDPELIVDLIDLIESDGAE